MLGAWLQDPKLAKWVCPESPLNNTGYFATHRTAANQPLLEPRQTQPNICACVFRLEVQHIVTQSLKTWRGIVKGRAASFLHLGAVLNSQFQRQVLRQSPLGLWGEVLRDGQGFCSQQWDKEL